MSGTVATAREGSLSADAQAGGSPVAGGGLRPFAWALAWGLGVFALWPPDDVARSLAGASRVALVWTPWVALVGLPGGRGDRRSWPLALGLALPLVALAAWIDAQSGLGRPRLEADLACGLGLVVLLGEAHHQAGRGGVRAYGWIWLALVAVLPALAVALAWGAGGLLEVEGLGGRLWHFSPVGTIWNEVRPADPALGLIAGLRQPGLSAAAALLAMTVWLGVRARGGDS